jgi:hypothetical protein
MSRQLTAETKGNKEELRSHTLGEEEVEMSNGVRKAKKRAFSKSTIQVCFAFLLPACTSVPSYFIRLLLLLLLLVFILLPLLSLTISHHHSAYGR